MRPISISAVLAACLLLTACASDSFFYPHRIDVRQGNYVDQRMVSQLRQGMTREQVRYVLGSPLVVDMFRTDRWDYAYRYTEGWGETQKRNLSLYFVEDRLDRVEGDVVAQGEGVEGNEGAGVEERNRVVVIPPAE